MNTVSERRALARLQRVKSSYQSFIKLNHERAAVDCRACPTPGVCCTDAHFVNVHITRLEAIAIRETLRRTPRITEDERRAVYTRAREAVRRYDLRASGDTFRQTYSCPLFVRDVGCLVHRKAKPAPCIQHACYERWEDLPPASLQARTERRVEQLNTQAYGAAWAWLPTPVWLCLVDPYSGGSELELLAREWSAHRPCEIRKQLRASVRSHARIKRASLPVIC